MKCDKCHRVQSELHQEIGTPAVYYCCVCHRCRPGCNAKGSYSFVNDEYYNG